MNIDRTYLEKNLKMLDGWSINVNSLTTKLSKEFLGNIDDNVRIDLENKIKTILTEYKTNKDVTVDDVYTLLTSLSTKPVETNETPTITPSTSKPKGNTQNETISNDSSGDIVEIDTETTSAAADLSTEAGTSIEGSTIEIPGPVQPFCGDLGSVADFVKNKIQEALNNFKNALLAIGKSVEDVDDIIDQIDLGNFDYNDIWNKDTSNMELYDLKPADAEFFKTYHANDPSFNIDENTGIVTYTDDQNNKYEYDLNSRNFTINGSTIEDVGIYVPNGNTDYQHMNVFTHFVGDDWDHTLDNKSNSIVITIKKSTVTQKRNRDDKDPPFVKQTEVPFITRFANAAANTERATCQNIIAGDSAFGAHSLGLTGSNPDLYDTVYCINNCVIVTGINNEGQNKVQITEEQLMGLDGKNIYFLNLSGDGNLDHNQAWKGCKPAQSCAIEGLELIADRCKNAKIYALYGGSTFKKTTSDLYQKIADEHPDNFKYMGQEAYFTFTNGHNYNTHSQGNRVMSPLVSMPLTNYNANSNVN